MAFSLEHGHSNDYNVRHVELGSARFAQAKPAVFVLSYEKPSCALEMLLSACHCRLRSLQLCKLGSFITCAPGLLTALHCLSAMELRDLPSPQLTRCAEPAAADDRLLDVAGASACTHARK